MSILPLLDDGACPQQQKCASMPGEVHATCPQAFKCGTCVAWSPREPNGYGRNSGQCMLNREARTYLDCNAQICPYYRPRQQNPVHVEWARAPRREKTTGSPRRRAKKMDREAPPPTPAALAMAAFADQPAAVGEGGAKLLEAELAAAGDMPVLLERYRGGTAKLHGGAVAREVALEAFYARVVLVRRAIGALDDAIDAAGPGLDAAKCQKDLAGIGGALTTFNVLFKDKADHFRGQGK